MNRLRGTFEVLVGKRRKAWRGTVKSAAYRLGGGKITILKARPKDDTIR
jgi:hypothetical protein